MWASVVEELGLSCHVAWGVFLDQELNQYPLHWKVDCYPPDNQGSPSHPLLKEGGSKVSQNNTGAPAHSMVRWQVLLTGLETFFFFFFNLWLVPQCGKRRLCLKLHFLGGTYLNLPRISEGGGVWNGNVQCPELARSTVSASLHCLQALVWGTAAYKA